MIAALMAYCLLASLLVAVMGRAFEEATRLLGLPTRLAWAGALALTLGLVAAAPYRASVAPALDASPIPAAEAAETGVTAVPADPSLVGAPLSLVRESVDAVLRLWPPMLAGVGGAVLGGIWIALSFGLTAAGLGLLFRSRRMRRGWPSAVVSGERVRIAPSGGPAVAGLLRPEIVVPRWLTNAPEAEQWMAVVHEREHVRAGDPYLLAFGYLAIALLPWNPAVWWLHSRLRLAVELDCDRRVLRRGVRRRTYGSFLIDAAALGRGPLPVTITLAPSKPTLERRILAMSRTMPRFAVARAALITSLGALALVAACEAELPTDAEVEAMDVAGAEAQLRELRGSEAGAVTYFVDGVEVTAAEARSVAADEISRIEIAGGAEGERVQVWTEEGDARRIAASERLLREAAPGSPEAGEHATASAEGRSLTRLRIVGPGDSLEIRGSEAFSGLLLVNGEKVELSQLRDLDPDRIESIKVLKGRAAERLYAEPEAAHGVILITTRR